MNPLEMQSITNKAKSYDPSKIIRSGTKIENK